MKLSSGKIRSFQNKIFTWWIDKKRDLPWRRTQDPYKILVSEIMLQQTQVSRVLPKYDEFLYFFPDVYTLAHASPAKVLRVWRGMGYNRRALMLQKAARLIVETYKGEFPQELKQLTKLPGVGNYTARAILVFAYKENIAVVDTNIRRIITHFFFRDTLQKPAIIQHVADTLLPEGQSWEWHQALMDYGALAMANVKVQMSKGRKKTVPFHESNRFYRGRIIDHLREGSIAEKNLIYDFTHRYKKPNSFFRSIIASLLSDGLIERARRGTIQLPDA